MSAPAGTPLLVLERVTRTFGDVRALDGVSLDVGLGEVVGLLGHNGAGKTTTVRLLSGLLAPDAGKVHVDGLDPVADGVAVRRRLGVLPAQPPIDDRLTGRANLRFAAELFGVRVAEVSRGLARVESTYTGGTLKWMGVVAPWRMNDGWKEFHLVAEPVRRQLAPGHVHQDRAPQHRAGTHRDETRGGHPERVQHVEGRTAMLRDDRRERAQPARASARVVHRHAQKRVTVRPRRTQHREDVHLVPPRQPLDQPMQAGHPSVLRDPRHAAEHDHADLHRDAPARSSTWS